jgi:ABC-type bacteriocin/lantibiotic exporter with double-glycine peptidase domain
VPLDELRRATGVSRDGLNAVQLREAARRYGLDLRAVRVEPAQLGTLRFPCIAHMRFIHFIVVEGIVHGRVFVNDQGSGAHDVPFEEFDDDFTGLAFEVTRLPGFVTRPGPAAPLQVVARHLAPAKWLLAAALMSSVLEAAWLLEAAGALGRWIALPQRALWPSSAVLFATLATAASWFRTAVLRWAGAVLAARHTARLRGRLAVLPTGYFALRTPRFVASRVLAGQEIGELVRRPAGEVISQLAGLPILAFGIAAAPAPIPHVAAIGCAVSAGAWWWLYGRRRSGWRHLRHFTEHTKLWSSDRLAAFESSRLAGRDADTVAALTGTQALQATVAQEFGRREGLVQWARRASAIVGLIIILAWPSGPLHADPAGFTSGLLVAVVLGVTADGPVRRGKHLSRLVERILQLDEFYEHDGDAGVANGYSRPESHGPGPVIVRNLTFGYTMGRPPILSGIDFEAAVGSQVVIAGASGSGRTTLARVVAGLYPPASGTVLTPGPCPIVDAEVPVFQGSVRDNVTLWDESIDDEEVKIALEDACLAEWVRSRAGGLDSRIQIDGTDMSGGERRRLGLARTLARRPHALVLDEVLDGLEEDLDARIRANLRRRGCTVIIVSDRERTLHECDLVIALPGPPALRRAPLPDAADGQFSASSLRPDDSGGLEECPADVLQALGVANLALGGDGKTIAPQVWLSRGSDPVRMAARASGLYLRRIRPLTADWFRRDHGVMVARLENRALPLLPRGQGGYRIIEGTGLPGPRLTSETAARLRADLFAVYRQPLSAGWSLRRAVGDALRASRSDAVAASAFLAAAWTTALFGVCHLVSSSAASLPLVIAVVPPFLACLFAEQRAWLRLEGRAGSVLLASFWARLHRVSVAWLRSGGAAEASRHAESLEGPVRTLAHRLPVTAAGGGFGLCALLLLAFVDRRAAAVCAVAFATGCMVTAVRQRWSAPTRVAADDEWLQNEGLLVRWLQAVPTMRLLGANEALARHWADHFGRLNGMRLRAGRWTGSGVALSPVLVVAVVVAACAAAAALDPAHHARVALFAALGALATSTVIDTQGTAALAAPAKRRLSALFAAPLEAGGGPLYLPRLNGSISLSDVGFAYPGATRPVFAGMSLKVDLGDLIAVTGPSGGGKTTLWRLVVGFERPACGRAEVGGIDLSAGNPDAVRPWVDVVSQDERLEPATIRWHIAGMAPHGLDAVWNAARLAGLDDEIRSMPMGLETLAMTETLSAGQVCGIQIARALLRRPAILILDEATRDLSVAGHARLFGHLKRLGTTVVVITHREDVLELVDRVVVVDGGVTKPRQAAANAAEGTA